MNGIDYEEDDEDDWGPQRTISGCIAPLRWTLPTDTPKCECQTRGRNRPHLIEAQTLLHRRTRRGQRSAPSLPVTRYAATARTPARAGLERRPCWLAVAKRASLVGHSSVTVRPSIDSSFCARNFAMARENVSLAAPSSDARMRLVVTSSKLHG